MIYYHKYLYMFRAPIYPFSGVQVVCCCICCAGQRATHAARHSVHTPQPETHVATTLQNL